MAETFEKGKRHILLFLDNAPVHVRAWKDIDNAKKLSHITLCFLPKNTTSKLQPADARWIQGIKTKLQKTFERTAGECHDSYP